MQTAFTPAQLVGASHSHLVELYPNHWVHKAAAQAILNLQAAAKNAGFDLRLASAFRSFKRQQEIWQGKACGDKAVLNDAGDALDISDLSEAELINAICRFSAIPGASRHHWGTDFDIYDANGFDAVRRPQLLISEYQADGPCAKMQQWLLTEAEKFGFCFPYLIAKKNGLAAEPWHISYTPLAKVAQSSYNFELFKTHLAAQSFALSQTLRQDAAYYYTTYIEQYYV